VDGVLQRMHVLKETKINQSEELVLVTTRQVVLKTYVTVTQRLRNAKRIFYVNGVKKILSV
jgi:hypothetical protein